MQVELSAGLLPIPMAEGFNMCKDCMPQLHYKISRSLHALCTCVMKQHLLVYRPVLLWGNSQNGLPAHKVIMRGLSHYNSFCCRCPD